MSISTKFTKLVGCDVPIQCAGMGGTSSDLAIAVAKSGALGMVSGALLSPPALTEMLDQINEVNPGTVGINFLIPFLEDKSAVDIAAARLPLVEFFYGDPDAELIERVHQGGALAAWQVGSLAEGKSAAAKGCDLIIAQGVEAGGHVRGTIGLMPLLEQILNGVDLPVVAAGGITTGRGVAMALSAGASAVRMGTRFVVTNESSFHADYKQALIDAQSEETVYTDKFAAMWPNAPHRVLRKSLERAEALDDEIVGQVDFGGQTIEIPRLSVFSPTEDTKGQIEAMALYAGQGVGMIDSCEPAGKVVSDLILEAEEILSENSLLR